MLVLKALYGIGSFSALACETIGKIIHSHYPLTCRFSDIILLSSGDKCKFLGITEKQYAETSGKITEILKEKSGMTAKQISQKLETIRNVSPILNIMCDRGLLIRGAPEKGWKSNIHTYHLLKEYFPNMEWNTVSEEDAKKTVQAYLEIPTKQVGIELAYQSLEPNITDFLVSQKGT
jgi:hypothetical protein